MNVAQVLYYTYLLVLILYLFYNKYITCVNTMNSTLCDQWYTVSHYYLYKMKLIILIIGFYRQLIMVT
jgi:hypothetical protein